MSAFFSTNKESKGEDPMKNKVQQLKASYTEADEMSKKTLQAIEDYKTSLEATQTPSGLFSQNKDLNCSSNFASLALTLEGQYLDDKDTVDGFIEDLPRIAEELREDLSAFIKADKDPERQKQYKAAIEFADKINAICDTKTESPKP